MDDSILIFVFQVLNFLVTHALTIGLIMLLSILYIVVCAMVSISLFKLYGGQEYQVVFTFTSRILMPNLLILYKMPESFTRSKRLSLAAAGLFAGVLFIFPAILSDGSFFQEYLKFAYFLILLALVPHKGTHGGEVLYLCWSGIGPGVPFVIAKLFVYIFSLLLAFGFFGVPAGLIVLAYVMRDLHAVISSLLKMVYNSLQHKRITGEFIDFSQFVNEEHPLPRSYALLYVMGLAVFVVMLLTIYDNTPLLDEYYRYMVGVVDFLLPRG